MFRGCATRDLGSVQLPDVFSGRLGYTRLLEEIPFRISISGTRGKSGLARGLEASVRDRGYSTLAKITGTEPVTIRDGIEHPIHRPDRLGALLDENIYELKYFYRDGIDVLIMENQGISAYTMRVFNELYCRPRFVVVPNIRRDHVETLGEDLADHAKAYGSSCPHGSTLISGVADRRLAKILRRSAEAAGAGFIDEGTHPPGPPGAELVYLEDRVIRELTGTGIGAENIQRRLRALEARYDWQPSGLEDVWWFPAADVNDVESTETILRFLLSRRWLPVSFIAYLRGDRRDRTKTFIEFFSRMLQAGLAERIYLIGHGSKHVARKLSDLPGEIRRYPDTPAGVDALVGDVSASCAGEAVMTVANIVPPLAREIHQRLRRGQEAISKAL